MYLTYEEIIIIMDANAGYLSMDTPENLYKFLKNIPAAARGSIIEFCYNDLKYPILDRCSQASMLAFSILSRVTALFPAGYS